MASFQTFWHGAKIPTHVALCMKSFILHGHKFHVFTYDENIALPKGVIVKDANDIINEREIFFYKNPDGTNRSVAAFANLFRYELLLKMGGWWVDTDVVCLSDQTPPGEVFLGWQDDVSVCNAIMKLPKRSLLSKELVRRTRVRGSENLQWGETGPQLLTDVVKKYGFSHLTYPPNFAYPVHWAEFKALVVESEYGKLKDCLAGRPFLHIWNEMFRLNPSNTLNGAEIGSLWHNLAGEIQMDIPPLSGVRAT